MILEHSDEGANQLRETWARFVATLGDLSENVMERADGVDIDLSEGMRFLARVARYALYLQLDSSDPDYPRIIRSCDETVKLFGDSPDYFYQHCTISGNRTYRITGTRGKAEKLHFSSYAAGPAGVVCTGEVATPHLQLDSDGRFELIVSPDPHDGNWLPTAENAVFLQVRNFFRDHERAEPARLRIEVLGELGVPPVYGSEVAAAGIRRATQQVANVVKRVTEFMDEVSARAGVNTFDFDQSIWQRIGGNATTYYVQGVFDLADDEALIVESDVPDNSYFSFQLNNRWLESLDYTTRRIYYSNYTAEQSRGRVRFIVSARDPGLGNWLDTSGHRRGMMLWKWNDPVRPPQPTLKKIQIGNVGSISESRS